MTTLAAALLAPVGQTTVAVAEDKGLGKPDLPNSKVTKVKVIDELGAKKARDKVAKDRKAGDAQEKKARQEQTATWPKQSTATLDLDGAKTAAPSGMPVSLDPKATKKAPAADGKARITVLDQKATRKAGLTGVLLTATAEEAGTATITVDYGQFASAVGGGWAERLRLVQLPACALTTPDKTQCRKQTPLKSANDVHEQSVSAQVALPAAEEGTSTQLTSAGSAATVLAVTAAASGGQNPKGTGDFSATALSNSSAWQAGGSSGSFTWSYDFTLPPAAAGPAPGLSLAYDSGGIDGRTAATNNQGSAVGEGFGVSESYIERSYGSCDKDGHDDVFDRCWKYDNARLVLNGKANRLIKVSDGVWRLAGDDASKVIRSTGADNGDDNGEHWTVITGNGTKYVFGLNKLEGAADQRTNSTWTVPVFGDDSGEPGYDKGGAFGDRELTQAWRWNLDYVEDTSGNAATYWYAKESNHYKKNKAATANASYTRGGYLKEIKYGLRKGALFTDDADAKVTLEHAERCTVSDCAELTKDTAKNWPDVPFDAICADGASECNSAGPNFFSRKRLTGINTYSWNATSKAYDAVDSWDLGQDYKDAGDIGDTSDHVLVLESIKRTAKAGTDIALNPITFTYQRLPNRVDGTTDDILPIKRHRISTITSETGAITTVTMSSPQCQYDEVHSAAEDTNTRSCYPLYWNINGGSVAKVDWFHKYRVLSVTEADPTGQNEAVEHHYDYSDAAWHYSDDPFTPKDERTWSDWRGYRQVTVQTGAESTTRSKTVSLYMQGMNGDKKKDGTTRSVTLAPLAAPALGISGITDSDQYAGQLRQKVTYNGTTAISAQANEPWSKETARQSVPDAADHAARYVRTKESTSYTYLTTAKKWRSRTVATTFDDYGMTYKVEDRGDDAKTGDETCQFTWYARNDDAGLTGLASRVRSVGKLCALGNADLSLPADDSKRGDVLSDIATAYDGVAWSSQMKPTKGQPTWTGRAKAYSSAAVVTWQKISATSYDDLGRPLSVSGADSTVPAAITAYTPAASGPLTKTIATDSKGFKAIKYLDARRGLVLRSFDANTKKTEQAYDALGRLTDVWLPNRDRGTQSPNSTFAYHIDNKDQSWVSSATLKRDGTTYNTSYTIYDALLRPLQTQSPTPQGGRILTDTRYDTRGLAYEQHADIFDTTSTPKGAYARAAYGKAPKQAETVFDGAGRPITSTFLIGGVKKWSTSTTYTGDSTATTALDGGSSTRAITDARGRTVETREYASKNPTDTEYSGDAPSEGFTSTKFGFTLDDKPLTITGPDQAKWSNTYDLYGRLDKATDPDKGTTDTDYDILDRAIKSTDAEGKSVLTEYDEIGRAKGTWAGTKSDATQLNGYTYDSVTSGKGLPDTSTRYVGGKTGQAYTQSVTEYDSLGRPTATKLDLPAGDPLVKAGAPQTLEYTSYYNIDGTLQNTKEPALGGLPSEIVEYGYNGLGQPTTLGGSTGYILDTHYTALGQADLLTLGTANTEATKKSYLASTFEEGTGRLTRSYLNAQAHSSPLQDLNYTYDQTGNVTSIADTSTLGGGPETQCFAYDGHQRLTEAWTPSSQKCVDAPSATSLSGPAPYWSSYDYNDAGQRTSETAHKGAGDTKTTYCYTKATQPHALTGTSTKADCASPEDTYTYDDTGNTDKRPGPKTAQDLVWSEEGKLAKLTEDGKATDYLYGPDGTLLIRNTQDGERILYAGATELHLKANGTTWAQRYYGTVAVRSNETGANKLTYLAGDHHGTQSLAITADNTQTPSKRYTSPFGAERGKPTGPTWPNDKGFLGKTNDTTTGLTHIGAREYDPAIGQFISVDPILELDKHQTFNGYSYGAQNPVSNSDPSGMALACGGEGGSYEACPDDGDPMPEPEGHDGRGPDETGPCTRCKDNSDAAYDDAPSPGPSPEDVLVAMGPASNDPNFLMGMWQARAHWGGGDFWDNPAARKGDGMVPTGMACFGKTGCIKAWAYLSAHEGTPGAVATAKYIAATYCLHNNCSIDAGQFNAMQEKIGDLPYMLAGFGVSKGVATAIKSFAASGCKCFLAGTDVLMADGTTKDIEDVELGDKVLAKDPETGEQGPREVTRLIVTEDDKRFNTLSIATDDGIETLTATYEHPFWSPSEGAWVEAEELKAGMTLLTDDGDTVIVTANKPFTKHARTYNLTVDDLHTYYVLAGQTPVLVHNSTCPTLTSAIHDDPLLVRAAQKAGKNQTVQRDLDAMQARLAEGNLNPGIGNGFLTGTDVAYARSKNGARLFFRNTESGIQIVGKADKGNEPAVIARLQGIYGR
ncbi:polymorphic toxin-type HINT domain-containing protein [Streptomyces sp. NBC_01304]|uniref:polymorphic toxin-type HINT domain-containing protein n=1 Tax=Streptomyces sp. NBC_01304 TaxID=2903818 RepID=UPI002E1100C5|nr:polymorphic toxin-type HINT domain-containing protein [Streptomyces sp. NBC_01304]